MEGLVTFEDILEEIVGEIQDEYDQEEKELKIMEDGTMVVKARMEIDHFNKQTKLNLPKKEYETVGGFVIDLIDRIPSQGEKIRYQDLIFEILEMKKRRILKIKITPQRETVSN
jgi:CBS domain containing-hemolysin-like protein